MIRELVNRIIFEVVNQGDLDRSNRAVDKAADNAKDAARETDRFERATRNLGRAVRRQVQNLERFSRSVARAIPNTARAGALGLATGFVTLGAAILTSANRLERLGELSESLGIDVSSLDAITQAAALASVSFEGTETSLRRLLEVIGDAKRGGSTSVDTFDLLGVSILDSEGSIRDTQELLVEISDSLNNIPSQAQRVRIASDLFGDSGAEFLRLLQNGSQSLADTLDTVSAAGLVTAEDAARAARFNDALEILRSRLTRIRDIIGSAFFNAFSETFNALSLAITNNSEAITKFFTDMAARVNAFIANGGLQKIADLFNTIVNGVTVFGGFLDRTFNLSDREKAVEEEKARINGTILERIIDNLSPNPLTAKERFARQLARQERDATARQIVDARLTPAVGSFAGIGGSILNTSNASSTANVTQTINIGGSNASPQQISQAAESGARRGVRKPLADLSGLNPTF